MGRFSKNSTGLFLLILAFFLLPQTLSAQRAGKTKGVGGAKDANQILIEVQRELVNLDRQFEVIRQDLFFPKNNEVLVYLRNNITDIFPIKTVELLLNGRRLHRHNYSDSEKVAFNFSNLQPLFRFSLKPGDYQLVARFTLNSSSRSKNLRAQDYRIALKKGTQPRFVEIEVSYRRRTKNLAFTRKIW